MDFRHHIQALAKNKSSILEIGPSYNPILPKSKGYPVFVVDHAGRSELVDKYGAFGVDTSMIEEVDFVTTDLSSIRSVGKLFDLVVASHVIEHVTDFIKFINDCESLLVDGGEVVFIVPDKRYCFDCFRPVSTPGAMVDAYYAKRFLHIGGLFDHYSYFCRNNGEMAWGALTDPAVLDFIHTPDVTMEAVNKPLLSGEYADAHEWVFVPASFAFTTAELRSHDFIRLGIEQSYTTLGYEFLVILSARAPVESRSKAQLLSEIQYELGEIIDTQMTCSEKQLDAGAHSLMHHVDEDSENKRLMSVVAQQQNELDSLYSSTSWRITMPLRRLRRFLSAQ